MKDLASKNFDLIAKAERTGDDHLDKDLIAFVESKIKAKRPQPKL